MLEPLSGFEASGSLLARRISNPNHKLEGGCSRRDVYFFLTLLLIALALRLYLLLVTSYQWDEERDWLLLAQRISLQPGHINFPLRGYHPALPAYFMKAGSLLLGKNPIGFRLPSVVAGIVSIVLAIRLALEWAGPAAARWTAVLLAFNEYHMQTSVIAQEKIYYLTFALFAIGVFSRFLRTGKIGYLYLAAVATGLSFLCKELAFLLLPAFLVVLFLPGNRSWLRRKEPYLAAKKAFLTGGGAISYAESLMGIVENYKLGEIVGAATAGTNGNINPFQLPGGYGITWTGLKVLKHDGSRHHGVGILPTIPVEPTQAGIAAGYERAFDTFIDSNITTLIAG